MVESTAPCRCSCQEDYSSQEDTPSCCRPHVFTSVLLGVLACVLMMGGVFLAFHRWDPLWLIVSAVGVVLVLIGSVLHCCSAAEVHAARRQSNGGKGCCGRPVNADHHTHIVANGSSLTEQLLPLSNARSVSQLSLNMLPGYFPPVVTTYGIEQHSAVVQNINRIVQQQQQQQAPQSPGSINSAGAAGKSFILLSLPGDTTQANIQNLVATVYQLDGNVVTEIPATDGTSPVSPTTPPPVPVAAPTPSLVLKNAEAQTCSVWPNSTPTDQPLASSSGASTSTSIPPDSRPSTSTACGTTQTEQLNASIPSEAIDLMDCSPVCDSISAQPLTNIPPASVLIDVSELGAENQSPSISIAVDNNQQSASAVPTSNNNSLMDLPAAEAFINVAPTVATAVSLVEPVASTSAGTSSDVLVDISEGSANNPSVDLQQVIVSMDNPARSVDNDNPPDYLTVASNTVQSDVVVNDVVVSNRSHLAIAGSSELSLSCDNLSDIDAEVDDGELMERSSPPPSYDDVAHEGESAVGAFGLAYGTI